ncbi:MAG: HlyD family efflux transporter periplasmic adaptor subunit [Bacteroidales bacterium]
MRSKYIILILIAIAVLACKNSKKESEDVSSAKASFVAEKNLVDTMVLRRVNFNREVVSNGNLMAVKKAELKFNVQGEIVKVFVRNGLDVRAGAPIVKLNEENLRTKLEQAKLALDKAELDFKDNLIGYGYGIDTLKIPVDLLNVAKIRSGYTTAIQNYKIAKYDLTHATLIAPFGGVIANLSAKPYEQSKDVVCVVIDDSAFDVEFNLLESELTFIKVGQSVKITPFTDLTANYTGHIKEINPLVDSKGQVKIIAGLNNKGKKLVDGMNVKVYIESLSKGQLAVPKSAVVIRDGYDVLFTLNPKTNKAGWVYVDVLASNSNSHVVRGNEQKNADLKEGEIIIVSGNLNLANDSNVEVKK